MLHEIFHDGSLRELQFYFCDRDENLEPGITYGPVVRDVYIIECCTSGYGAVVINGVEYAIAPGDGIVLFPGDVVIHKADYKEPRQDVWCAVDGMQIASFMKKAGISSVQPYISKLAFRGTCSAIETMLADKGNTDSGATLRNTGAVYRLMGEIVRFCEENMQEYARQAICFMEAQYDRIGNVEEIAAEVGLERAYFSTVFKSQTGKTPHAYLTELRVKKACTFLLETDYKADDVAIAVGIAPENFTRLFKRVIGLTPREYIRSYYKNEGK